MLCLVNVKLLGLMCVLLHNMPALQNENEKEVRILRFFSEDHRRTEERLNLIPLAPYTLQSFFLFL